MNAPVLKDVSNKIVNVASSSPNIVNDKTTSTQTRVETSAREDVVLIDEYIKYYDKSTKQYVLFKTLNNDQLEAKPYEINRAGFGVYKINEREGIYRLMPKFLTKTNKNKKNTLLAIQKGKLNLSLGGGIIITYKSGDVIRLKKGKYIL